MVTVVLWCVLLTRFLLPLAIPRWPLPAVVACLVVDGVDQTVFQSLGLDPPGYQSYDKAMDVYYLAVAYLATLRNWSSGDAFAVSRFLYYYRLVGVVAFELLSLRVLLLVFPNTFEYFFIAYESVRSRWDPARFVRRWWIGLAALIWVVVKLPQEYWIHVARLDVTDVLAENAWATPVLVVALLALAAAYWFGARDRLPAPDHSWRIGADPLPEEIDTAREQAAWRAGQGRVLSVVTAEKVVLLGLLSVVFAQSLPGVRASNAQLFLGVAAFVVVNAALVLAAARRRWSLESLTLTFAVRALVNVGLVLVAAGVLGRLGGDLNVAGSLFFVVLVSLLTTLHDRYQPVHAVRRDA